MPINPWKFILPFLYAAQYIVLPLFIFYLVIVYLYF